MSLALLFNQATVATPWVRRTASPGGRNGTNQHAIPFAAASAGNLLLAVVAGAVTHTAVTAGWTKAVSQVSGSELAVFTRTATGGETSLTVQHNGSNYPIEAVVYEFPAGSSLQAFDKTTASGSTWPGLTGLTGTPLVMAAVSTALSGAAPTMTTSAPWVEDYHAGTAGGVTDGSYLGLAYQEAYASSTVTPNMTLGTSSERVTMAITVAVPGGPTSARSDLDLWWRVAHRPWTSPRR